MSDIVEIGRQAAKEIADQGINGWGNTMSFLCDEVESLRQRIAKQDGLIATKNADISSWVERDFTNQRTIATLKEQNALLTVQVQEADKREWLMGQLIGEIASAGGKYPYVNNTELVRDAHKVMRDCLALTAHPQQVKSEDARDAERYRWLREQHWDKASICVIAHPKDAVKLGHDCPSLDRLDAAIDAAISAQAGDS